MKRFIVKVLTFCLLAFFSFYTVFFLEDGNSDPFGMRFTTGKKKALIIGNSRGAQGLIPEEIESELTGEFSNLEIYNYCFAIGYSAFGPTYLNSIKDKVAPTTEDGLFIISLDPWALLQDRVDFTEQFRLPEESSPLAYVKNISFKPHIKYMLNWFEPSYYEILNRKFRPANEVLHRESGWLEVVLPMDPQSVAYRVSQNRRRFSYAHNVLEFSEIRMNYLIKTIEYLKRHGRVYLVYIPSHPELMVYEEKLIPGFSEIVQELSGIMEVPFLDLGVHAEDFLYTEGIHLYQDSGKIVSQLVGNWINNTIGS